MLEKELRTKDCPQCDERSFEIDSTGTGKVRGKCNSCGYEDEGELCDICDEYFQPNSGEGICESCFNKRINNDKY